MSISKIQKGDNVKVHSGNFKGTVGTVLKVIKNKSNQKTYLEISNVKTISKFQRSNKQYAVPGSIKQVGRKIDSSNVALVDSEGNCSKIKRVKKDNKFIRVYKTTNKEVIKILPDANTESKTGSQT